jgi:hypothetical protein
MGSFFQSKPVQQPPFCFTGSSSSSTTFSTHPALLPPRGSCRADSATMAGDPPTDAKEKLVSTFLEIASDQTPEIAMQFLQVSRRPPSNPSHLTPGRFDWVRGVSCDPWGFHSADFELEPGGGLAALLHQRRVRPRVASGAPGGRVGGGGGGGDEVGIRDPLGF